MNTDYFEYINNFAKSSGIISNLIYGNTDRPEKLFTIAIPTYNRPNLLEVSLKSAINQIYFDDFEIIIVDNSPDNYQTEEIVKSCGNEKVYYFRNEKNIGMFGNWNRCIELSKGKYITILNDDDYLSENYLYTCSQYLVDNVDGLYFDSNVVDYRKDALKRHFDFYKIFKYISKNKNKLKLLDFFYGNRGLGTLGIIFRTDYVKQLGGYNEDYFPSSDYILHANYCSKYNVYRINKRLNFYRIQENESAKQETLRKWEYLDEDIRLYFADIIGKKRKTLYFLNRILQANKIEGMVNLWKYQTDYNYKKYRVLRKIIIKFISLKYHLNL